VGPFHFSATDYQLAEKIDARPSGAPSEVSQKSCTFWINLTELPSNEILFGFFFWRVSGMFWPIFDVDAH
jgi:hypothetical protein